MNTKHTTPATDKEGKKYHSRYGIMTGRETAEYLLNRSWERLMFLERVFAVLHQGGDGYTLEGYASCGLSAILEDVGHDVYAGYAFLTGDDPEPGKDRDAPQEEEQEPEKRARG